MRTSGAYTRNRVIFERRGAEADDAYGNVLEATWSEVCTCFAAFRPEFGREQLEAGRLESIMRGTVTARRTAATKLVTGADRIRFLSGPYEGNVANIRSIVPAIDGREIEFMIETNVAT